MIKEYIDKSYALFLVKYFGGMLSWSKDDIISEIVRKLEAEPAEDVKEVKHGEWVPFYSEAAGDIQYCSVCNIGFPDPVDYCPHCGAEMVGSPLKATLEHAKAEARTEAIKAFAERLKGEMKSCLNDTLTEHDIDALVSVMVGD